MSIGLKVSRINAFTIDRELKIGIVIFSLKIRLTKHKNRLRQNPTKVPIIFKAILRRQWANAWDNQ